MGGGMTWIRIYDKLIRYQLAFRSYLLIGIWVDVYATQNGGATGGHG